MRGPWMLLLLLPSLAFAGPTVHSHKLKSGLEVLVVENHALPLVTIEIAAKNGSMTESPEYNGLSHLYEHMFFKANAVLPNQEAYMARMRELGMTFNGSTNTERVNYFFSTTQDHLQDAMAFMRDAIVSPLFDPKELERERVVVTGEIDRNEASPFYHFAHTLDQRIWWKYPSYKDPLGNRKTVLSATREKMQTIQKRYYIPNNSVLVVTGDVQAQEIDDLVEKDFADWKAGEDPFKKHPLMKHPPIKKSEVVVVTQPVQTVVAQWTWHGPSTVGPTVPLSYPADLLSFAIREPSSKFQQDLVDSGACVSAQISWYTQMNTGPISLQVEAVPEKVDECIQAVLAELPKMKTPGYLSDEELKNAFHSAEVEQILSREKPSELAHTLTFWWTSAGLDYYLTYLDKMKQVTQADSARYMDTFLLGQPYVFGAMVSPEMEKTQHLDAAHFEQTLGLRAKSSKEASR